MSYVEWSGGFCVYRYRDWDWHLARLVVVSSRATPTALCIAYRPLHLLAGTASVTCTVL